MAGDVVNIKFCIPLKLRSGLTGKYHAICHYSYNLPLGSIAEKISCAPKSEIYWLFLFHEYTRSYIRKSIRGNS